MARARPDRAGAPATALRSFHEGVAWPALPSQRGAALQALLFQLEQTQWWTPARLVEHQLRQLAGLVRHAWETVPWHRQRLADAGYRPDEGLTPARWRALPVLGRRDIQDAGEGLLSGRLPPEYTPTIDTQTSGSTGQPVKIRGTQLDALMWEAITLREHLWHRRDFSARLAVIRANAPPAGGAARALMQRDWGPPAGEVFETGPSAVMGFGLDVAAQALWLMRHEPDYLLTYPANLAALIRHCSARGERPSRLKEVRTIGETVTPELRAACLEAWNVPLVDAYSSQELGYLALQCPEGSLYHVMSESVLLEVLDAGGAPCAPGETGRVVATGLHNLAMPLLRYELGDYAEAGPPCSCGRGLPTLKRILGRSRNMLRLPGGALRWPLVGFSRYREVAPIRQYQLVQRTLESIEARFVVDRPLGPDEEARLAGVIRSALGHDFRITFAYFDGEIPRTAGGKFEEFVSEVE
ncbi:MAG: phenylacetate--CoA ligase family protein [Burkholderiales bacterium]|nr:phenylacetate--CoA ligase family protein [Burkholderiales bacterium]